MRVFVAIRAATGQAVSGAGSRSAEAIEILPIESPVERVSGRLRADLEKKGQPIGGNDLLIAAQSMSLGLTLVTDLFEAPLERP
jgi:predicted nucleic acid-binding protein